MMDDRNGNQGYQVRTIKLNILSIIAFVFGILSLISITTILFSLFFGSLAVIFAVLSKGYEKRMDRISLNGFWLGLTAVITSLILTGSSIYLYRYNEEYHNRFNQIYEQLYGISFEEYTSDLFRQMSDGF